MDIYPGQAEIDPREYLNCHDATRREFTHAIYERTDRDPPTLHLLPKSGHYEDKKREDGEPLFLLRDDLELARDDHVMDFGRSDVQHAERTPRRRRERAKEEAGA